MVLYQYGKKTYLTDRSLSGSHLPRLLRLVNTKGSDVLERSEKSSAYGPLRRFADP
jgi:hypothetical protein